MFMGNINVLCRYDRLSSKRFTNANFWAQPLSMGVKYFMVQGSATGSVFLVVSGLGMFLVLLLIYFWRVMLQFSINQLIKSSFFYPNNRGLLQKSQKSGKGYNSWGSGSSLIWEMGIPRPRELQLCNRTKHKIKTYKKSINMFLACVMNLKSSQR